MFWMTYDGTMNSALFTEFLDLLIHDIDGKIFLIVDNVKYHASKETSEWVKEHRDRIELFFLPSYSLTSTRMNGSGKTKNDHIAREVPQRPGHLFEIARRALRGFRGPGENPGILRGSPPRLYPSRLCLKWTSLQKPSFALVTGMSLCPMTLSDLGVLRACRYYSPGLWQRTRLILLCPASVHHTPGLSSR